MKKIWLVVFFVVLLSACGENPLQPDSSEMKGVITWVGDKFGVFIGIRTEANEEYILDAPEDVINWLYNNQGTLVTIVYSEKFFDEKGIGHLKVKYVQITIGQKK